MIRRTIQLLLAVIALTWTAGDLSAQIWKSLVKKERPTFKEIKLAVNDYWKKLETQGTNHKPAYKQFKRWEWFAQSRLDQDGYFNPGLLWEGYTEKIQRFGFSTTQSGSDWQPLGPSAIPQTWQGHAGMGRLNCITFDPKNPNTIWVGAPTGGLWKTPDGGQTWTVKTDHLPNLGVSDILIHPHNPQIMYIATGDRQRASTLTIGVLKSMDGGTSWMFTGLNPKVEEDSTISKMEMHPNDPETIIAAGSKGIYKTTDGGTTWELKAGGDFFDLEIHASNPSTWYATRFADGVYRSVDSGESWLRLSSGLPAASEGLGRIALAVAPSAPRVLYALYSSNTVGSGWVWEMYGLYRSNDGGNSWTQQTNATPNILGWAEDGTGFGGQAGYALVMKVNPANPDVIYAGSVNLWRSSNGGVEWEIFSSYYGTDGLGHMHVDLHELEFLPGSSNTLFCCNDGGLHKSENAGQTWTDLSGGLTIHQVYRIAVSEQLQGFMVVGAQDNGSEISDNGAWRVIYGGDGNTCLLHPNDSDIMYCSSQRGNYQRSIDGGEHFIRVAFRNGAWVAPLLMHPHDPETMFCADFVVAKSTEGGYGWEPISPYFTEDTITQLAVAPSDGDTLYATDGTEMFRTYDGGAHWEDVNTELFPTFVSAIEVHPEQPRTLWVSFGGYGRWNNHFAWENIPYQTEKPKVYRSHDGGNTWEDVSGLLPNIPVNCTALDPESLDLYIGTDLGVFVSPGGGTAWRRFDNNLPNVIVTDLKVHRSEGNLAAATYGRGVWKSPLATPAKEPRVFPPLKLKAQLVENRSLLQTEMLRALEWQPNPVNANQGRTVSAYRVYAVSGAERALLGEVDASAGRYVDLRRGTGDTRFVYAVTAVGSNGNESVPLFATLAF